MATSLHNFLADLLIPTALYMCSIASPLAVDWNGNVRVQDGETDGEGLENVKAYWQKHHPPEEAQGWPVPQNYGSL